MLGGHPFDIAIRTFESAGPPVQAQPGRILRGDGKIAPAQRRARLGEIDDQALVVYRAEGAPGDFPTLRTRSGQIVPGNSGAAEMPPDAARDVPTGKRPTLCVRRPVVLLREDIPLGVD